MTTIVCQACSVTFTNRTTNAKHCIACRRKINNEASKLCHRKRRSAVQYEKQCKHCSTTFSTHRKSQLLCQKDCPKSVRSSVIKCAECGIETENRSHYGKHCIPCGGMRKYEAARKYFDLRKTTERVHNTDGHYVEKCCLDCEEEFASYHGRSVRCRGCQNVKTEIMQRARNSKIYWAQKQQMLNK